ncbi:hypothetical protein HAX54_039733 [Datura stramonium]|uniref:Uncharacterized protein n=1 Tax=Datura stramonium TaxID=4076 RepID=A0ABS8VR27_DATST|nr:hypothetical protein [Datura stramonium]
MAGKVGHAPLDKFASSLEGIPAYGANSIGAVPPVVAESGDNLYLLAKKMSLERQRSLPKPHTQMPSMAENVRQQPHNQNVDLISLLQGVPDRSAGISSGISGWSNFPVQGGLEPLQERMEMHQGAMDNTSSILATEKLLAIRVQDPQLLNLLQQQ